LTKSKIIFIPSHPHFKTRICLQIRKNMSSNLSTTDITNNSTVLVQSVLTSDYLANLALREVKSYKATKSVAETLVMQAIANNPLNEIENILFNGTVSHENFTAGLARLQENLLSKHFMMLKFNGISFNSDSEEINNITSQIVSNNQSLLDHVNGLKNCFYSFQTVFKFIQFVYQCESLDESHMQCLASYIKVFNAINDNERASEIMLAVKALLEFNQERFIYKMPTILSLNSLPEILVAMPVWYIDSESQGNSGDTLPSEAAKYICNLVGSYQFRTLYQIYNRRDRHIDTFPTNPDPIPTAYAKFAKSHSSLFSQLVITTPYHSISSSEWADPNWQNSIDPCALGFFSDSPYFAILDRWSGNNLLPGFPDMIGDTIDHLATNKHLLSNFEDDAYWYNANSDNNLLDGSQKLVNFAEQLISAFNNGVLFDFLRGAKIPA
jgi:hypothetical protein